MNILSIIKASALVGLLALGMTGAHADTLLYTVDYTSASGFQDFTFSASSNPVVTQLDSESFYLAGVVNTSANNPFNYLTFYTADQGGGFAAGSSLDPTVPLYFSYASQPVSGGDYTSLFSGSVDTPTLLTGSFVLTDFFTNQQVATLLVTTVSAVPETSTWAMMILGFSGIGLLAYRKRRVSSTLVG